MDEPASNGTTETAIPVGSSEIVRRRMSRVEIAKAIEDASEDEPFTMPMFLASCLVKELRTQKLNRVEYTGTDFRVVVTIKKAKPPNDPSSPTAHRDNENL